jgi:hypothetical protein
MQRSPSGHRPCSQTLITGSDEQDTTTACACFQKTDAIVKDPCPCTRPAMPSHNAKPILEHPTSLQDNGPMLKA